jgi:NAD(P)H-hydrate epimerase
MKLCTIHKMHTILEQAHQHYSLHDELLMEHAGMAAVRLIAQELGIAGKTFCVVCGPGDSGGRGFVVARHLHANGGKTKVCLFQDLEQYTGNSQRNLQRISCLPIEIIRGDSLESLKLMFAHCDVLVDALLDIDTPDDIGERYNAAINVINASPCPVISLDLPSGIDGDTGHTRGAAVQADYTMACGLPKVGSLLYPGYGLCGKLSVTRMSLPPILYNADSLTVTINEPPPLPPRSITGHKGTFGDVLIIAGAASYYGAPYFAATAVLKAGAGYARLAAPQSIVPVIAAKGSELVFVPQQETDSGSIAFANKEILLELVEKVDLVILGPGLSLAEETQRLVRELVEDIEIPLLLDGDGITAVCQNTTALKHRRAETVLTPHVGEMSRITGKGIHEIKANLVPILQRATHQLNSYIVLKGAHSLIGYPDERIFINMSGNSGMGTAGSGDVLAGTVAAMFGLGLSIPDAIRKGVFLHGLSGDLAALQKGEDGITAQDILDFLPQAVKLDREGLPPELSVRYQVKQIV